MYAEISMGSLKQPEPRPGEPELPAGTILKPPVTLVARCESRGQSVSFGDSWIAATALRTGIPLVTHNARHYHQIEDLEVITCS